jgi:hypothetical protein
MTFSEVLCPCPAEALASPDRIRRPTDARPGAAPTQHDHDLLLDDRGGHYDAGFLHNQRRREKHDAWA